jgi:hypothetical protein
LQTCISRLSYTIRYIPLETPDDGLISKNPVVKVLKDFYDHAKKEYIDVLRNHHYLFTINRVGSEGSGGYEENDGTLEKVLNNPPVRVIVTLCAA